MDFRPGWGASPEPLAVIVPPLSTKDILHYLVNLFPPSRSSYEISPYNPRLHSIYTNYVKTLYSVCSPVTRDPQELAYIAAARWPGYVAPLLQDWKHIESQRMDDAEDFEYPMPSDDETLRLLTLFKSTFVTALNTLHPRLSHARAWAHEFAPSISLRLSDPSTAVVLNTRGRQKKLGETSLLASLHDLPARTRILLVASYLASHNPARTDIKMFGRMADGGKKKSKRKVGPRKPKNGVAPKVGEF